MSEVPDIYLMRFEDGPLAGVPGTAEIPVALFGWPLPDRLGILAHLEQTGKVAFWDADDPAEADLPDVLTGSPNAVVYRKVSESQLPSNLKGVARGALYRLEITGG